MIRWAAVSLLRFVVRPVAALVLFTSLAIAAIRLYARELGPPSTDAALLAVNITIAGAAAMAVALVVGRRLRWLAGPRVPPLPPSTSQGSARWGSTSALRSLRPQRGLLVGREPGGRGALLRYAGDAHVLTLAPTGAGKGVGCVIPNLLTYPGSVLVTDPKGENYAVSAARRRQLGHHVVALDPFDLVGGGASFNPLGHLDPSSLDAVDDAVALAELLVMREPRESGDTVFWSEEAKALLAGLILHVAASETPERRTLATVWEYLSLAPAPMRRLWTAMSLSDAAGGAVARAGARIRQKADRVRAGILAQAQSQAHFLESPRLSSVLRHSTFSFADLKTQRVSIYLVLPPERMDAGRRWLRLLVGCALHALTRTRAVPAARVLLLLDEFAALGPLPPLERAVALARGYGACCWLLAQDLAQVKALYPAAWPTFVANAGLVQVFGTNDVDTAAYVSDMLGSTTVRAAASGRSRTQPRVGSGRGVEVRDSWTESDRARALLSPDEVRRLGGAAAILLTPGADPLCVERLDYRTDPAFRGMFEANPMY